MKLERMPLNKMLYEQLKQDIIERRIEFGEKLTNRELQQRFGVSSTPVRDAINHLYLDGLVEDISNSGARVITFDLQFTLEVNEMVSLLCCAAVECASVRADQTELCTQLERVVSQQEYVAASDEYYHSDFLFHKAFFEHCKNSQYQKNYSRYHVLLEMLVRRFHGFPENRKKSSVEQHKQILHSYRMGETQLAVEQTKAHFLRAEQLFRQYME